MDLDIALGVVGILLSIILSVPTLRGIKRVMDRLKRLRWSGALYREGLLQKKRHIAFDEWSCLFFIDDEGNCAQSYKVRVINTSNVLVAEYFVPLFCDTRPLRYDDVAPWAKAGRKKLTIFVDAWDEERGEGRLKLVLPSPLAPGERLRFSYGLTLPRLFVPGEDYYNWDVELPYYDLKGELLFSSVWKVRYARWQDVELGVARPPILAGQQVTWHALFPPLATRLHMRLGLENRRRAH